MKKPEKFNNYVAALLDGVYGYPSLAEDVFRMSYGLEPNEVAECGEYLDYVVEHDMVERKTCVMKSIKNGAMYDVYQCTECGTEFAERNSETYVDYVYCPICGAKVVY